MSQIAVPEAPAVPNLRFRHFRGEEDFPGMLRVYTAVHEHDGLEEVTTLEQLKLNYATLVNCDPARDMLMAEVDGELVAYARVFWNELVEGGRSYENFGFVHPAWRRRGIGTAMHRRNEARLLEIAAEHVDVAPKCSGPKASTPMGATRRCCSPTATPQHASSTTWLRRTWTASSSRRCPTGSSCVR